MIIEPLHKLKRELMVTLLYYVDAYLGSNLILGETLDGLASHSKKSRNTPSSFMLQKLQISRPRAARALGTYSELTFYPSAVIIYSPRLARSLKYCKMLYLLVVLAGAPPELEVR